MTKKEKWARESLCSESFETYWVLIEIWMIGFEFAKRKLADNIEYHDHEQFIMNLGEEDAGPEPVEGK